MESARKPIELPYISNEHDVSEDEHRYELLNSPQLRAEYLSLTDDLVYRMVEQNTDVAIFLDKSARPVAWMVNELWDTLAPEKNSAGEPTKKPQIKFLNIDREQWGPVIGRSEDKDSGGIHVDRLDGLRDNPLGGLKELYAPIKGHSKEGDVSLLTDKNVLIVDEVKMSGDTLGMSKAILQKAFPDAREISGTYWMPGKTVQDTRSGVRYGAEVPVWYSDREVTGRLVGNRDTTKSLRSNSSRQRAGRYWLSTPFREPDLKGMKLKQEVKWMAEDLRSHELPYMPSFHWSESFDPIEDRVARIDGIGIEEYVKLRQESHDVEDFVRLYANYVKDKTHLDL